VPADFSPLPGLIQAAYSGDTYYAASVVTANIGLSMCAGAMVDSAAGVFTAASLGLATIYGNGLSAVTDSAPTPAWTTALDGVSVVLKDPSGNVVEGLISYVSPTQINFAIPSGLNSGPVTAEVTGPANASSNILNTAVTTTSPSMFVYTQNNQTFPAAQIVSVMNGIGSTPVPLGPITFTDGVNLILTLYATGIRNHSASTDIRVEFGSSLLEQVEPTYAGKQLTYPGLDQINIPIPTSLAGSGMVSTQIILFDTASATVVASSKVAEIYFP
jgi:uncharacterized protein (TIGR03437 family)